MRARAPSSPHEGIDALVPKRLAEKAAAVGVAKAALRWGT